MASESSSGPSDPPPLLTPAASEGSVDSDFFAEPENVPLTAPLTQEPPSSFSETVGQVLTFLGTATPETLGGVLLGAALVLYVIFGSLGLLLIGILIGVVLHASLENGKLGVKPAPEPISNVAEWLENKRREELDERRALNEGEVQDLVRQLSLGREVDFSSLPPETASALEELTNSIIRDYVRWWYTSILPQEDNFPNSCRQVLIQTLLNMYSHISRKRPADTFLLFLVSTSNTLIVFFRELSVASQTSIGTYIEESPASALAQLLDRETQKRKLRMAADDIVQSFMGKDVLKCEPVRSFLTEIIAGVVLEMTVEKCSSAEFINSWIVFLLEQETQPKILQKIDIGEATAAASGKEDQRLSRISRAEEEMKRAMQEAEEMNRMFAEEEAKAKRNSSEETNDSVEGNDGTEAVGRKSTESGTVVPSIPPQIIEEGPNESPPQAEAPTQDLQSSPAAQENAFTSFDQLVTPTLPPAVQDIFHRASVNLSDLTPPSPTNSSPEKFFRSKPTSAVYLLQIEPHSTVRIPGWILTRKYTDFESLHEVLKRISIISGVFSFKQTHSELPPWKMATAEILRSGLESYLNDALKERGLAECEGMKRFLEKDNGSGTTPGGKSPGSAFAGLGKAWPNPQAFAKMGEGVRDVFTKAPQGAAEGGKNFFGGVFAGAGNGMKRVLSVGPKDDMALRGKASAESLLQQKEQRSRSQTVVLNEENVYVKPDSLYTENQRPASMPPGTYQGRQRGNSNIQLEIPPIEGEETSGYVSLPPPPSDMPDDYDSDAPVPAALPRNRTSSAASSFVAPLPPPTICTSPPPVDPASPAPKPEKKKSSSQPLTEQEAAFMVDITFAVISELYTLSSAWLLRRSLLNVAKSILLRPGNASLESIRLLINETLIDANTQDSAIAKNVRKIRANAFPTAQEKEAWPSKRTDEEKEELRDKARALLVEKGLPEALRGVMGNAATSEACGVLFDALQERGVARGVVGGLLLEGVRGVCQ